MGLYDDIILLDINPHDFASSDGLRVVEMVRRALFKDSQERGRLMSENTEKVSFMDRLQGVMEKYIVPVGQKISSQRHLAAVRDGLTIMIPATIIGGFSC